MFRQRCYCLKECYTAESLPGSSSVKGEKNWAHFKTVCGDGKLMFAGCLGWCLAQAGWHLAAVEFLNISPGKKAHPHHHLFSFVGKLGVKSGLFSFSPAWPKQAVGDLSTHTPRKEAILPKSHPCGFVSWRVTPFSPGLYPSSHIGQDSLTSGRRRRLRSPGEDEDGFGGGKHGSMITLNSQNWILWTSTYYFEIESLT